MTTGSKKNLRMKALTFSRLSFLFTSAVVSPMHELVYFGGKGRGEAIRVMLHASGVEWKDTTFKYDEWADLKPTTPLGAVPILKIDGNTYCQSLSLLRYAGKLAGFYPEDPLEALKVDQALDSLNELMSQAPRSKDDDELKKLRKEYQDGAMTKYMTFLESTMEGTGFASTPSVADLALSFVVQDIQSGHWTHIDTDFFEKFPKIR